MVLSHVHWTFQTRERLALRIFEYVDLHLLITFSFCNFNYYSSSSLSLLLHRISSCVVLLPSSQHRSFMRTSSILLSLWLSAHDAFNHGLRCGRVKRWRCPFEGGSSPSSGVHDRHYLLAQTSTTSHNLHRRSGFGSTPHVQLTTSGQGLIDVPLDIARELVKASPHQGWEFTLPQELPEMADDEVFPPSLLII